MLLICLFGTQMKIFTIKWLVKALLRERERERSYWEKQREGERKWNIEWTGCLIVEKMTN